MWTTPTLLLSCSFHAPSLLLPYSSPAPASALPLPYSCPAPFKLLSCTFLAPPQFLTSSCPLSALLCFTLLTTAPALFLPCSFLPRSCFAPALLLPCPWSFPPQLGRLHYRHQHLTTFFGISVAVCCCHASMLASTFMSSEPCPAQETGVSKLVSCSWHA